MKPFVEVAGYVLVTAILLGVLPGTGSDIGAQNNLPMVRSETTGQKKKPKKPGESKIGQEKTKEHTKEEITKVQKALRRFDYYDGPVDGKMNAELKLAIRDFQDDENLLKTGELDEETFARILILLEEGSDEEPPRENSPGSPSPGLA